MVGKRIKDKLGWDLCVNFYSSLTSLLPETSLQMSEQNNPNTQPNKPPNSGPYFGTLMDQRECLCPHQHRTMVAWGEGDSSTIMFNL